MTSCERWREAVSAAADGEETGLDPGLVEAHLARCASCRSFATVVDRSRRLSFAAVTPMPDLSPRVARLAAVAYRAARWRMLRLLLAAVAVQIVVISIPALLVVDQPSPALHSTRHLGAFTLAYAVGLLVVAVVPARARTMLPVAAVLAATLVISAVFDLFAGRISLSGEMAHLPEVLSVMLVWLMTVPAPRLGGSGSDSGGRPELRVVDDAHRGTG